MARFRFRRDRDSGFRDDTRWVSDFTETLNDLQYQNLRSRLQSEFPSANTGVDLDATSVHGFGGHSTREGENALLNSLTGIAFNELRLNGNVPPRVGFSLVAVPTLNGFALRAPFAGTPVIVLNHGLVPCIGHAFHLVLGLSLRTPLDRTSPDASPVTHPYCPHHPDAEFLRDLGLLAAGLGSNLPVEMLGLESVTCLQDRDHDWNRMLHHDYCMTAELFIILHEMGHVVLGHCDDAAVTPLRLAFDGIEADADVFIQPHAREFAADRFAAESLGAAFERYGMSRTEMAYALGCLFAVLSATEFSGALPRGDTHPPATARWRQLMAEVFTEELAPATNAVDRLMVRLSDYWS
jgi:hypothetical protein